MRKIILFAIMVLTIPTFACADIQFTTPVPPTAVTIETKEWSHADIELYLVRFKDISDESRIQSYCGPSRDYHGAGAYRDYKMTRTEALFIEEDYAFVDMSYSTVGRRCVYFPASKLVDTRHVPQAVLSGEQGTVIQDIVPMWGPGTEYDKFSEAKITKGTLVSVYFETNGYLFAEFNCALGTVRAWLPVDSVC